MKKMKFPQLRRLALLALVMILVVSCFSACGRNGDPDETVNKLPSESQPSEPSTPSEPDQPDAPSNATEPPASNAVWGTVNADQLNFRPEPSMDSKYIGRLAIGTRVQILETKVVETITWGRIDKGWVNMTYITLDGEQPDTPDTPNTPDTPTEPSEKPTEPSGGTDTPSTGKGKMGTTTSGLNIREGAGSKYKKVGEYKEGTRVEILETKNGWGKTDKGWISLNYVKMDGDPDKDDDDKKPASDSTTGTVIADKLNIREGAGTDHDKVGEYHAGDRVKILEKDGTWGKTDKGWISLNYVNMDGETGKKSGTVIITIEGGLNVRKGPGTDNDRVDTYGFGKSVTIYDRVKIGGATWACTKDGWINISSKYVYIQGEKGEGAGSGTITGDDLNVRTGPGTGYKSTGKLNKGDKVEILFQIKIGDDTWGYTKDGWISMKYVEMAKAE